MLAGCYSLRGQVLTSQRLLRRNRLQHVFQRPIGDTYPAEDRSSWHMSALLEI